MKKLKMFATLAALTFSGTAWATDCAKWSDHAPGYCGVTSNDYQCNSSANRVPGKCSIPSNSFYVNSSGQLIDNKAQAVLAQKGTFALLAPNGTAINLVASGGGNLVASGGGNLVASGGGNLAAGRALMSTGKKVFIVS